MKRPLKTVDWFIIVTSALDILLLFLLMITPSCNRTAHFVHPADTAAVADDSEQDIEQAIAVGNSGDLKVTLLWDFPGDIDLHIIQPNSKEINYMRSRDSRMGGYLDVDNTAGGVGSAENIYYESPKPGQYEIYLKYYSSSSSSGEAGAGTCRVVVFQNGHEAKTYSIGMSEVGTTANVTTVRVQ